ncbi:twin-arginine translocase subunit TatC [Halovivax limisalsi]|uniref:twin-arginine translocase subunit TatC n=1 Tax=Halovivax limisalsi TaxID=1453760 RepID=UPI001FFD9025|nr:twin-arginine translocase subunit TatC [Halovivax limisalsi]
MPGERDEPTADDGPDEPREGASGTDSSAAAPDDAASEPTEAASEPDEATSATADDGSKPDAGSDDSGAGSDEPDDTASTTVEDEPDDSDGNDGANSTSGADDADTADGTDDSTPADPGADSDDETQRVDADGGHVDRPDNIADRVPDRSPEQELPGVDDGGFSKPPDDEEMPLADHVEEMVQRLAVVLLFAATGTAIGILFATDAITIIWTNAIPQHEEWPPHLYHPLELWLTRIKVAGLLGIIIAIPAFVYQTYLFMRPGLYPNERKYYLAAVPTSVVLAAIGMFFSYFFVLPVLFEYFTYYSEGSAEIQYALGDTFNLVITLTAFLAIVFQIPLFIMLAIMMGVVSRRWLAQMRLYFWAAFVGLAFMFTIDPTMMAAGFVALTMIALFEGTLAILKWVGVE